MENINAESIVNVKMVNDVNQQESSGERNPDKTSVDIQKEKSPPVTELKTERPLFEEEKTLDQDFDLMSVGGARKRRGVPQATAVLNKQIEVGAAFVKNPKDFLSKAAISTTRITEARKGVEVVKNDQFRSFHLEAGLNENSYYLTLGGN